MSKLNKLLILFFLLSLSLNAKAIIIGFGNADTTISKKLRNGLNAEYIYKNNMMVSKSFYFKNLKLSSYAVSIDVITSITIKETFYNDSVYQLFKRHADSTLKNNIKQNSDSGIAEFIGGDNAFVEFLENNIKYPETAKILNRKGIAMVEFDLSKEGVIRKIECNSKIDLYLIREALRVILLTDGYWAPKKLHYRCRIPITFELD